MLRLLNFTLRAPLEPNSRSEGERHVLIATGESPAVAKLETPRIGVAREELQAHAEVRGNAIAIGGIDESGAGENPRTEVAKRIAEDEFPAHDGHEHVTGREKSQLLDA